MEEQEEENQKRIEAFQSGNISWYEDEFLDLNAAMEWINEGGTTRLGHREAWKRLATHFDRMADLEVAVPNAFDKTAVTGHGPVAALFRLWFALTQFPRAYYARTVQRMLRVPAGRGALIFGSMVTAELMSTYVRRILNGEKLEDINNEFRDDPTNFIANTILRTPILGIWGYDVSSLSFALQGKGRVPDLFSGAGQSMVSRLMNDAVDVTRFFINGDPPSDATKQSLVNLMPVMNSFYMRAAIVFADKMDPRVGDVARNVGFFMPPRGRPNKTFNVSNGVENSLLQALSIIELKNQTIQDEYINAQNTFLDIAKQQDIEPGLFTDKLFERYEDK